MFFTESDEDNNTQPVLRLCHPHDVAQITRRQLLKYGSSLAAYMTSSQLFPGQAFGQSVTTVQRRLVWIMMDGGWDILEVTDPKPGSTSGIDMTYSWDEAHVISGADQSERVGRWLPSIAALGSDLLVVRGLAMGTTSHQAGAVYMDTGVLSNSGIVNVASIPAIVASQSEATLPLIQLQGGSNVLTDRATKNVSVVRAQNLDLYRAMYPASSGDLDQKLRIMDHLKSSAERLEQIIGKNDRLSAVQVAEAKIRIQFQNDVRSKLELLPQDTQAFTVNAPQNLSRTQRDSFAMAAKLLKNNLVTSVNLGVSGFDTHSTQDTRLEPILAGFDYLLSTFVQELRNAGHLDNTLIVVISDFGRTPKVNSSRGRDHWPVGGALMIGGGIQGGRVVGATDSDLRALAINTTTGQADGNGQQISSKHLGGSVVDLCLGNSFYSKHRSGYLYSIPALTKVKP